MKHEKFSSKVMDKLAGELSENEIQQLKQDLLHEPELATDFDFFEQAWSSLDDVMIVGEPSQSLEENFYQQLELLEEKQQTTIIARLQQFAGKINQVPVFVRNTSFGAFLLLIGFLLGGKFNHQPTPQLQASTVLEEPAIKAYTPSTDKINYVRSINNNQEFENDNSFLMLKNIVKNEKNVNVRLAALNQMNRNYSNHPMLKQFLSQQLEIERVPLIQVELLNLMIDNHQTGETIQTMENILIQKQNLNPFVQEKIKKDLPVLRASYIQ